MDLDKAVSSCDENHPIVLLAHRPAAAKTALDSGYNIRLVLSGTVHVPLYFMNDCFYKNIDVELVV